MTSIPLPQPRTSARVIRRLATTVLLAVLVAMLTWAILLLASALIFGTTVVDVLPMPKTTDAAGFYISGFYDWAGRWCTGLFSSTTGQLLSYWGCG